MAERKDGGHAWSCGDRFSVMSAGDNENLLLAPGCSLARNRLTGAGGVESEPEYHLDAILDRARGPVDCSGPRQLLFPVCMQPGHLVPGNDGSSLRGARPADRGL